MGWIPWLEDRVSHWIFLIKLCDTLKIVTTFEKGGNAHREARKELWGLRCSNCWCACWVWGGLHTGHWRSRCLPRVLGCSQAQSPGEDGASLQRKTLRHIINTQPVPQEMNPTHRRRAFKMMANTHFKWQRETEVHKDHKKQVMK